MQRLNFYWILLPLLVALSGCALPGARTSVSEISNSAPDRDYPIPRHLRYSFTLQNTHTAMLDKAEFWVYVPVRQTSTQRVAKISASHGYQLVVDKLGNQILHFEFENFPPLASKVIDIQADLFMSDTANPASGGDSTHFLAPERYVEADAPEITALAKTLRAATPIATSKAAYAWVAANLKAENFIPEDRGALYALHNKSGDCTEFMDLFVALSRANGIPARGLGGYVVTENAIVNLPRRRLAFGRCAKIGVDAAAVAVRGHAHHLNASGKSVGKFISVSLLGRRPEGQYELSPQREPGKHTKQ